jgi:hypothetical protein
MTDPIVKTIVSKQHGTTTLELLEALQEIRAEAQALEREVREQLDMPDRCLCPTCLQGYMASLRGIESQRPPARAGGTVQTAYKR